METMSLTEDVSNLMDTLGPVYEYVEDEPGGRPARKKHVRFSSDGEPATTNGHGGSAEPEPEPELGPGAEQNGVAPPPTAGGDEGSGEAPPQHPERWAGSVTSDTDDDDEFNDPIGVSGPEHRNERWSSLIRALSCDCSRLVQYCCE